MSIAPGTRLGPFDVTAPLGAGGMNPRSRGARRLRHAIPGPGASFQAGAPQLLFSATSGTTWDPSPDAKRFLIEQSVNTSMTTEANLAIVTDWFDELRRRAPAKK